VSLTVVATVFVIIFLAELPDKTALASLVLSTRYRPAYVFAGVAAAFAMHAALAVGFGSALALVPRRPLEAIVGVIFLLGAILLIWRGGGDDLPGMPSASDASFFRIASAAFGVVALAEFGDVTQILTASLAVRYHSPGSVLAGSVLALWSATAVAVVGGRSLLRFIPVELVTRVAAVLMAVLGVAGIVTAAIA
jgi:putative Ca2+/H+ antiporter (TMEM165/GDT1 family)